MVKLWIAALLTALPQNDLFAKNPGQHRNVEPSAPLRPQRALREANRGDAETQSESSAFLSASAPLRFRLSGLGALSGEVGGGIAPACALEPQDVPKPADPSPSKVEIAPGTPTEKAWTLSGKVDRPDGSVVKVTVLRLHRTWDAKAGKFHELPADEFRAWRSAAVRGKAFDVAVRKTPPGLYRLTVTEEAGNLYAGRVFLGNAADFLGAQARMAPQLLEAAGRLSAALSEIEEIALGKKQATRQMETEFLKRITKESEQLRDGSAKIELTATISFVSEIATLLLNAQVWNRTKDADASDLGGVFPDPSITIAEVRSRAGAVKGLLAAELRVSAAAVAEEALARARTKPEKLLGRARDVIREAHRTLQDASEPDKEFLEFLDSASSVGENQLADVHAALQAKLAAWVER